MRTMGKVLLAVTLLATAAQAKDKPAPVAAAAKPVDKDALTIRRLVDGLRHDASIAHSLAQAEFLPPWHW